VSGREVEIARDLLTERHPDLTALSNSQIPQSTNIHISSREAGQDDRRQMTPIPKDSAEDSTFGPGSHDSSTAAEHLPDNSTNSREKGTRTKRRRIVSDPDMVDAPSRLIPSQVKEEPSPTDVTMVDRTAFQVAADGTTTLEIEKSTQVVEVEVPILDTVGVKANKISDAGEESPERAAVESAIDEHHDEQSLGGTRDEEKSIVSKPRPKTYAKKRKALDNEQIASDRAETPTPGNKATSSIREPVSASALSTPLTGRSKPSLNQTSAYVTRAKNGNPSTTASDLKSQGSPFSKKRQQVRTSKNDENGEKSPGIVRVKEEAHDPMNDGRPRITGGDDEGMHRGIVRNVRRLSVVLLHRRSALHLAATFSRSSQGRN
jgi:hypothetical protein